MNEKKWAKFFELMAEVVNDGRPHGDKMAEVCEEARNSGVETVLMEFVGWDWPE